MKEACLSSSSTRETALPFTKAEVDTADKKGIHVSSLSPGCWNIYDYVYIYILIIYICVCLCTNQITFFVWSFYIRLIRLALAFSEAFFASSAKSGAPSARDRKTLPGRSDRFAPSRSEKVA